MDVESAGATAVGDETAAADEAGAIGDDAGVFGEDAGVGAAVPGSTSAAISAASVAATGTDIVTGVAAVPLASFAVTFACDVDALPALVAVALLLSVPPDVMGGGAAGAVNGSRIGAPIGATGGAAFDAGVPEASACFESGPSSRFGAVDVACVESSPAVEGSTATGCVSVGATAAGWPSSGSPDPDPAG